ncbi:TetR/AcrR family transcriptional regulator [Enterococcus timonensis]|uniref:TetR/AcrR family transcriptional regulator n=1 Tax=Enterococcus timonensis TaxID=1852364 RepID=UPI0008DA7E46|nr:TetR/AcrR family transcriptional regulator [Enterococcus timonensis]
MPENKKTDLRKIRTKKMIIDAFLELVEEKGMETVTIQEIADKAMINRATFYAHFTDKQDLYDSILEFASNAFTSVIQEDQLIHGRTIKLKHIENLLTNIYITVKKNQRFFITLTDGYANEFLRQKLADLLYVKYHDIFDSLRITENNLEVPLDFIIEYMTAIFMGTLHWWLTADSQMTPDALARLVIKLVANGHLTVMGIEVEKN